MYASDNIEVIEIGVPADHITTIDHEMKLPNEAINIDRKFKGQKNLFITRKMKQYDEFRIPGFKSRDTGIARNTNDVASVHIIRPSEKKSL